MNSIALAAHVARGLASRLDKVVDIHGFAVDYQFTAKSVARKQTGVFGTLDNKLPAP
jgi:hypothetical protein